MLQVIDTFFPFFFFKDLLKHTSEDHPDHSYLLDAQRNIKHLAEKINKGRHSAEEAEREARVIQEIEAHIEGIEHVRKFVIKKKKRSWQTFFLFF